MSDGAAPAPAPASGKPKAILVAEGVEKVYTMAGRPLQVLKGVTLRVREHEILAIQGPSGAGKSTLLHVIGLLDVPSKGSIYFRDVDLANLTGRERARYRNRHFGFVFQFYHLFRDCSALENVCLPRMVDLGWFAYRRARSDIEARARMLLDRVGLKDRERHRPAQLSGGERQRVAIARALMNEPAVVLCDEPTGNLDLKTAQGILDLIFELNRELGETFVVVTHDEHVARRAHRRVTLIDGVIRDEKERDAVLDW